ncbi:MAG: hypothetical protein JXR96_07805 [Deltaproteobacteria bacterium]|nr:hypothetical protein [Deltaproteobacteria bacterium]
MKTRLQAKAVFVSLTLILGACGGGKTDPGQQGQPVIGEPYQSECLGLMDGFDSDTVELIASGNDLRIVDHYTEFNCCLAAWMEVELDLAAGLITVLEVEDPDDSMACDCMCGYELAIEVSDLPDGVYTVAVYKYDVREELLLHREQVEFPASGQASDVRLASFEPGWMEDCPDCYGSGAPMDGSRLTLEVTPGDADDGRYSLRGVHEILCTSYGILDAELAVEGRRLTLTERDAPVDCICCAQADFVIEGLSEGTWTLEIYSQARDQLLIRRSFQVPGAQADPYLADFGQVSPTGCDDCYGPNPPSGTTLEIAIEPGDTDDGLFVLRGVQTTHCVSYALLGGELAVEGRELVLVEDWDYDNPADCIFSIETHFEIADLSPGSWTLRIVDTEGQLLVEQQVEVG